MAATTPTPPSRPRLGDLINAATRTTHTHLNKTILSRLPLALPPSTTTPALYTTGLLHIAPIYLVFESLWLNLVSPSPPPAPYLSPAALSLFLTTPSPPPTPAPCPPHILHILTTLLPPSLPRTPSLQSDLSRLLPGTDPTTTLRSTLLTSPRLSAFLSHTHRSVSRNPHVLLAYAWVLYMALFSGGRFILATLQSAGPVFWGSDDLAEPLPLSFFRFPGADNGEEEVKGAFKARLAELEAGLSEREVEEVVEEARRVFEGLVGVVGELEDGCTEGGVDVDGGWVAGRGVRDSVVLAKERRVGEVKRQVREMVMEEAEGVVPSGKVVRFDELPRRSLDEGTRRMVGTRNLVLVLGVVGVLWGIGRGSWGW